MTDSTIKPYRKGNQGTLSNDQVNFYDLEGYLVLPSLLDEKDMAGVIASMEEQVDDIADDLYRRGVIKDKREHSPYESRLAELFEGKEDVEFLRYGRGWRDRLPGYFDLMSNQKILDVMESLIGGEIFSNPVYNTRPKVPVVAAGVVPWHQDKSYWLKSDADPVITVWIALVDATRENGCLQILPRSHLNEVLSYHRESYSGTQYTEIDQEHLKDCQSLPLPLKAGGAILFNDRCIHNSTPNLSKTVRWSVDLRYQPAGQDPMIGHGIGFLARSRKHPGLVATLEDWLASLTEHIAPGK